MDNMSKIKKVSKLCYILLLGILILVPLYYIFYWLFINSLSESFVNINIEPIPETQHILSPKLQIIGFISSLLPLSALMYGLIYTRKLFAFFKDGVVFALEQVVLFKKISKALIFWVIFSIVYEGIKSVIFSFNNPVGERVLSLGLSSSQVGILFISIIILVIAWIMDEGRIINEENKLTV